MKNELNVARQENFDFAIITCAEALFLRVHITLQDLL